MKQPVEFGKYLLLDRINVGGMAEVFRAKTFGVEGFERILAVKKILSNIAEDQEFITMFIDEAKIAVQLTHANIAQIFDLGKVDESYFIAMEYVYGKDLRAVYDRMKKDKSIPWIPMACYVSMKACEGLDYAHNKKDPSGKELNLVHRDVSPQNVLISYDGEIKIIDFGVAKAAGKAGITQAGILKGKFGYMSPEQVKGMPLDRRSDIFALGIVLYELLTGERLFASESDFLTLEKVRNAEILPPTVHNKSIPEELEKIVLKALAKDISERYQTAMDLHDDLQSFMYTSANVFSRKELSQTMKLLFSADIQNDDEKRLSQVGLASSGTSSAAGSSGGLGAFEDLPTRDEASSKTANIDIESLGAAFVHQNESVAQVVHPSGAGAVGAGTLMGMTAVDPSQLQPSGAGVSGAGVSGGGIVSLPQQLSPPPPPPSASLRSSLNPSIATPAVGLAHQPVEWDDEDQATELYGKSAIASIKPMHRYEGQPQEGPFQGVTQSITHNTVSGAFTAPTPSHSLSPQQPAQLQGMQVPGGMITSASLPPHLSTNPGAPFNQGSYAGAYPSGSASQPYSMSQSYAGPHPAYGTMGGMAGGQATQGYSYTGQPSPSMSGHPQAIQSSAGTYPSLQPVPQQDSGSRGLSKSVLGVVLLIPLLLFGFWFFTQKSTLRFETVPQDVEAYIDGNKVDTSSSPFVLSGLSAGSHQLIVRKEGYKEWKSVLNLPRGGEFNQGTVNLLPANAETGIFIDSQPNGAKVYVDGIEAGKTPARITTLQPGKHNIRVDQGPPFEPYSSDITVVSGQMVEVPKVLLKAEQATVKFDSSPSGASVTLRRGTEELKLQRTPHVQTVDLRNGSWTAEFKLEGYETSTQRVEIPQGSSTTTLAVLLRRRGGAETTVDTPRTEPREPREPRTSQQNQTQQTQQVQPSNQPATLRVQTTPWSYVTVDGRSYGTTPQRNISLSPGRHTVVLENPDANIKKTITINLEPGETKVLVQNLI